MLEIDFLLFPYLYFSSNLRASRRTRLWREGIGEINKIRGKLGWVDFSFYPVKSLEK